MDISAVSPAALAVIERLERAGYEAYLVGGCVRDLLRGVAPHDFDVATLAMPDETLAVFRDLRTIETGLSHGTVTVLLDGEPIEVTTYRVDGEYSDHRRPDRVSFTPCLTEDLARRDFTVNAMAYSPSRGFCDPFDGRRDLDARILRAVGDPEKRFSEDALRILRALRFSSVLGFSIETKTASAAYALADTVPMVAAERIREEIFRLLVGKDADRVLSRYSHILSVILPEVPPARIPDTVPADPILRVAAWLENCRAPESVLVRLRTDNATKNAVLSLLRLGTGDLPKERGALCRLLRKEGREGVERVLIYRAARGYEDVETRALLSSVFSEGAPYLLSHLSLDGKDLRNAGIPAGPLLGRVLEGLYDAVVDGRVKNEKEQLLLAAMTMYRKECDA